MKQIWSNLGLLRISLGKSQRNTERKELSSHTVTHHWLCHQYAFEPALGTALSDNQHLWPNHGTQLLKVLTFSYEYNADANTLLFWKPKGEVLLCLCIATPPQTGWLWMATLKKNFLESLKSKCHSLLGFIFQSFF